MRVYRPSQNDLIRGYSRSHKGYDFSGVNDTEKNLSDGVFACKTGRVVQSVDKYNRAWRNWGKLTTRDYGNYCKIQHDDGTYSLYAHLKSGTVISTGKRVKEAQRIATIGNTGNSTGLHLHFEFRNKYSNNKSVTFYQKGVMKKTVLVEAKKFEELVTKSSKYDEFKTAGFENAGEVLNIIQGYKDSLKEKDGAIKREKQRAASYRDEFNNLVATISNPDHLNTTQDVQEILLRSGAIGTKLTQLEDITRSFAALSTNSAKTESDLKAHIKVLEQRLKQANTLESASLTQFIKELIRRLKEILEGIKGR